MSKNMRKIGYWGIEFTDLSNHCFNRDLFCQFWSYLNSLPEQEKLYREEAQYKAVSLESARVIWANETPIYKVIFKSCKYHHSPDYMSSTDGSERRTDKRLDEGDKEITHMCFRVDEQEAYAILEERRNGVTMKMIIRYLNRFWKSFIASHNDIDPRSELIETMIPSDGFLESLKRAQKISIAELFIEKEYFGSGYFGLLNADINTQNEYVVTVKAEPRKTISKDSIEAAFLSVFTEGSKTKRIRIRGKDTNGSSIMIDSLNAKKVDEISVKLLENGIVDSSSIFEKFVELLGESNE